MSVERRGVQSVEVGARLLRVLAEVSEPMMLRDLARQAGIAPAQAHAYLVSYRKQGLVEQSASAGRYRLGPFALLLGIARMRSFDPMRMAGDALSEFASETGFSVALSVWGTHGPTVIQVEVGLDQIYTKVRPGTVFSVSGTATGKAFAAFLPHKLVKEAARLENSEGKHSKRVGHPVALAELADELDRIRERGYATIVPPPIPGVHALSAPVLNHFGQMQMAITLIGPALAFDISESSPLIPKLLAFTRRLSAKLGFEDKNAIAGNVEGKQSSAASKPEPSRPGRPRVTRDNLTAHKEA